MKTTIEVTEADIEKGAPRDGCGCPLALAISRKLDYPRCSVALGNAVLHGKGFYSEDIPLPEEACEFYHDFDYGRPVSPFSFTIDVPEKYINQ